MQSIKKNNLLFTFSKTFFLASVLCTFVAHADSENTEKKNSQELVKEIEVLKKKLKEEKGINIIIQNELKTNESKINPTVTPEQPTVTPEKPKPKFKLGGMARASLTTQFVDLHSYGIGFEGGLFGFLEYKFSDWFGLRSGIVSSTSSISSLKHFSSNSSESRYPSEKEKIKVWHVSVPIILRFYPGKDRQFCLYVGPRFGGHTKVELPLEGPFQKVNKANFYRLFVFGDFGFDYETKIGFIFGLDGIGLRLGWNVAALF